jgi:arsenical pump membrane protein
MTLPIDTASTIWGISALATGGVIIRPWRVPEYVWAVTGAGALVLFGFLPAASAVHAIGRGTDVYLFLIGMMVLAELARIEGLFDWLALQAVRHAKGSSKRLFILVYLVGTLVTVLLSNDATAVVLTPAVYAATRAAKAEPLPYLFICAFIANAASFVLPISNPANLVLFGSQMPPLTSWLWQFGLPSLAAIGTTFIVLWVTQRRLLYQRLETRIPAQPLSKNGRRIAWSIGWTAVALLTASFFDVPLGLPAFLAGASTAAYIMIRKREWPIAVFRDISWGVLPLVAGLFILVQGLQATGLIERLAGILGEASSHSIRDATWWGGMLVATASNLINNLPTGLIAGSTAEMASTPVQVRSALLIGVDLGPNLSVTGSLATILWLVAIRREGGDVGALKFLKLGMLVMPPALGLSLATLFAGGPTNGVP